MYITQESLVLLSAPEGSPVPCPAEPPSLPDPISLSLGDLGLSASIDIGS